MDRVAALIDRARTATGLVELGEESYREGLEILVSSCDREARLTEAGRAAVDHQIVDLLSNRLQVEHWYRLHPEIDNQQIVAPVIGLGLPRTGSTALACMLGEDLATRSLRSWEAAEPCPPPEAATQHADPRIARAQQRLDYQFRMFPRMRSLLPLSATAPTECQNFMGYDFKSQTFFVMGDIPTYRDWLCHKADLVPTYRYVKRVLQLLQWHCPPRRWRLKNPSHCMFIGALSAVFPDARFWMTHRDIGQVIPSVSDLYFGMMSEFSDRVDKVAIGEMNVTFWETAMRRLVDFRDRGQDHRFHDIQFAAFQQDPLAAIGGLYHFLGETLGEEAQARMQAWWRDTPRQARGAAEYEAADFEVDTARLRQKFAFYSSRFG